ncbi:MAG: acyl-CoA thioesterase [Bacteroidales bacterium]|nr:acyl-CoA thioesterase [Bacteroidales bacterium]
MEDGVWNGYPVVVTLDVAWGEMDAFQHVNNVVYFRYFEAARIEFLARVGWLEMKESLGIGPIVQSTQARFRRPLQYPARIQVGARIIAMESDRVTFAHQIICENQDSPATEGQAVVVCFDYRAGQKVPLPQELRDRIAALTAITSGHTDHT